MRPHSEQKSVPLTPAEQMKRIREIVAAEDLTSSQDAYRVLALHFARLGALRQRIDDLEGKMLLREQPFESHAPLIGPLIVQFRRLWNWMSTKWYVLPLIAQQSEFNVETTRMLREIVVALESVTATVHDLQAELAEPESRHSCE